MLKKTRIFSFLISIATISGCSTTSTPQPQNPLIGTWEGKLQCTDPTNRDIQTIQMSFSPTNIEGVAKGHERIWRKFNGRDTYTLGEMTGYVRGSQVEIKPERILKTNIPNIYLFTWQGRIINNNQMIFDLCGDHTMLQKVGPSTSSALGSSVLTDALIREVMSRAKSP